MNIKLIFGLVVVGAISAFGQGATNLEVRTKADKVNLRVRPEAASEVVGQVGEGQVLAVTRIEGEWLGVVAPTNAGVWVKSQFVKDGVATGDKIRLRAGPGIGFRDVGLLRKGDKVVARDTHGEWLRIAPPAGLILWVSQTLVDLPVVAPVVVVAVTNVPVAMVATGTVVRVETPAPVFTNSVFARDLPAGLTKKDLAPQLGQGLMVERAGVVERVPFGFFRGAY
ncbi:MAG: SH3 domain-containing protein, partial [bacterium]